MAGRRQVAAPGEPQCPEEGCERPAGFATEHAGQGFCRRHDSGRALNRRTRKQKGDGATRPQAAPPTEQISPPSPDPLARRLTGSRSNPEGDPLGVLRRVLSAARKAGYPFDQAWAIAAEAALSYMSERRAREWWEALSSTERAWADAYAKKRSRLEALRQG